MRRLKKVFRRVVIGDAFFERRHLGSELTCFVKLALEVLDFIPMSFHENGLRHQCRNQRHYNGQPYPIASCKRQSHLGSPPGGQGDCNLILHGPGIC